MIPHPPEKIWRALTQGELLEEWLMKNDFTPTVGAKFTFRTQRCRTGTAWSSARF